MSVLSNTLPEQSDGPGITLLKILQVLNGNSTVVTTVSLVSPPATSASAGTLGQVSVLANGHLAWYTGTQWVAATGSTF